MQLQELEHLLDLLLASLEDGRHAHGLQQTVGLDDVDVERDVAHSADHGRFALVSYLFVQYVKLGEGVDLLEDFANNLEDLLI